MLWGLCHGVCKLRCPKEGGPICRVDLDWESKLEHRGPKTQQKNYTVPSFLPNCTFSAVVARAVYK